MSICKRVFIAPLATLALSACGEADATGDEAAAGVEEAESAADAESVAVSDSGTDQDSTPAPAETRKALPPIPAAFHGKWGMLGDCSDPMVINANGIESRRAPPLKSVKILAPDTIELDREADPQYPDQDQRFGLSVAGDEMLIYSAPQMSSLRFERCGTSAAKKQTAVARSVSSLPASFRGQWDGGEYGSCESPGPDAIRVEADRIVGDVDSGWKLAGIERVDASTYRAQANYFAGDYLAEPFQMTLRLKDAGKTLELGMGRQGTNVYDQRCG